MARYIYITSPEGSTGKAAIALGLVNLFVRRVKRVGVFRPVIRADRRDTVLDLLLRQDGVTLDYEDCVGVTYDDVHDDADGALARILDRVHALDSECEVVVVVGSDFTDVTGPTEFSFNARVAANLGAAVVLTVHGLERDGEQLRQVIDVATSELTANHASVVAVVANRVDPAMADQIAAEIDGPLPTFVLAETPLLHAPSVRDLMAAVDGTLRHGDESLLDREVENIVMSGMGIDRLLDRISDGTVVIVPADRSDAILGMLLANSAEGFPSLAALILNGGFEPADSISRLMRGLTSQRLPIINAPHGSFATASRAAATQGLLSTGSQRKTDVALRMFESRVDAERLLAALDVPASDVVTPLMFEHVLVERARASRKRIVLPEGTDDRILRAASRLLARDMVDLTILGAKAPVRARATELGLDIEGAQVLDPATSEHLEQFAEVYTGLRAHKGMTIDRAHEIVSDVSYFGTLMVHLGLADGMVSGAQHTTAHTIKPSFEIIKTAPTTSIVSSVFFMCLPDQVLVYGDCAVNPDPNAEQLADIAISSASTAAQFGVDPRVAMLSYSTGESGSGADVDKVRTATALVRERAPHIIVEGPIQYDAAVDSAVAASKMPGSDVAGRATVLIFPDLNTGNNTYKAVQRSAGAVAIGPVLQGLNKPVNDLSRGALVQDIVNTVAITAIQAQGVEPTGDQA